MTRIANNIYEVLRQERNRIATNESGIRRFTIVDCFDFGRVRQPISLDKWMKRLRLLNRILWIRCHELLQKYRRTQICGNGISSSYNLNTDGPLITAIFHELKRLQRNIFKHKFRVFFLFQ